MPASVEIAQRRPIAVDLFSGVGGFSLGFIQAGFEVVTATINQESPMEKLIEAYPLHWPAMHPRTSAYRRKRSTFDRSFARACDDLLHEIKLSGGQGVILSTNILLRRDGLPLAGHSEPNDPGVAVYFKRSQKPLCFACDAYQKVWENLVAIEKTINALRGIERWGSAELADRAYTGFVALPPPSPPWWSILGVTEHEQNPDVIQAVYRSKAMTAHPDRGGSHDQMAALNRAMEEAEQCLRQEDPPPQQRPGVAES